MLIANIGSIIIIINFIITIIIIVLVVVVFIIVVVISLVSLVGKVPVYRTGGLDSIPGRTNTQGLKIIEKVLPLL